MIHLLQQQRLKKMAELLSLLVRLTLENFSTANDDVKGGVQELKN